MNSSVTFERNPPYKLRNILSVYSMFSLTDSITYTVQQQNFNKIKWSEPTFIHLSFRETRTQLRFRSKTSFGTEISIDKYAKKFITNRNTNISYII